MARTKKIKTPTKTKKSLQSTMTNFLPKAEKPVVTFSKLSKKPLGQVGEKMQELVVETVKSPTDEIAIDDFYMDKFAQDLNAEPMDFGDNIFSGINEDLDKKVDNEILEPTASDKKPVSRKKSDNKQEDVIIPVLPAKLIWLNDGNRNRIEEENPDEVGWDLVEIYDKEWAAVDKETRDNYVQQSEAQIEAYRRATGDKKTVFPQP